MKEKMQPQIDEKTCAGCSLCVENCPMECLKIREPAFHGDINTIAYLAGPEDCIGCGLCEKACPIAAITLRKP